MNPAESPNSDRLSRIETMLERIVNVQDNQQTALGTLIEGQNKLVKSQLALQVLQGQIAEQILQLKRAVDYLLSNDGGNPE